MTRGRGPGRAAPLVGALAVVACGGGVEGGGGGWTTTAGTVDGVVHVVNDRPARGSR